MRYVVDSNVAVVANGGEDVNASSFCRLKAIDFLEALIAHGRLIMDLEGEVNAEYHRRLRFGEPGVGNRFLQAFLSSAAGRVEYLPSGSDGAGTFDGFSFNGPLKNFDKSDRKFAVLSKVSEAPVANACDSDWVIHKENLEGKGVKLHFVCGTNRSKWFEAGEG